MTIGTNIIEPRNTTQCTLKPIQDVVLVKPAEINDKSAGGIIIPDKSKMRTCEGTVAAAGPGLHNRKSGRFMPMTVKKGDKILFEHGRGVRVEYLGQKYIVMREPDIALILDDLQGNEYDPSSYYDLGEIKV